MTNSSSGMPGESLGVIGWFYEAFHFVGLWFVTRSPWMLLRGLPAAAVFVAIPVLLLAGQTTANQEGLRRKYQLAAIGAFKDEDYAAAELWNRKLLVFDETDREAKFRLGLAIEKGGDVERGREYLKQLTPADGLGFLPAHLYLATCILDNQSEATAQELRTAVSHLDKVLEQEPDNLHAREMMVRLQLRRGELLAAADHLSRMVTKRPELHLMLAGLYKRLAMEDAAAASANRARVHFEEIHDRYPDDIRPLLRISEAHVLMYEFEKAEQLLEEHLAVNPDVAVLKQALLNLALLEIDIQLGRDTPDWPRVVRLLERSLRYFPSQDHVFARVALVVGRFQGAEAAQLRQTLEDALANGTAPAVCHLLLGTMVGQAGKTDEAIQHLRAAHRVFPNNPIVLNNLAYYLTQTDPPQLAEALEHAHLAVEKGPRVLEVRETRGQILAALGRSEEALPDLEAALGLRQVPVSLHTTLAKVYADLGNPQMAARHRERAAEKMR
jgi:tetratricopeptide (TPR) repeat protein